MTIAIIVLLVLILLALVAILNTLKKRPLPPKVEIPPAKEVVINIPEPQKIEFPKFELPAAREVNINTEMLQEIVTLMRVNQAEFQSGLEAFHKSIDKLLTQIPNGEKELNAQKEFVQKFEEAFVKVQENAAEAMSENSLRLQEILTEILNKKDG